MSEGRQDPSRQEYHQEQPAASRWYSARDLYEYEHEVVLISPHDHHLTPAAVQSTPPSAQETPIISMDPTLLPGLAGPPMRTASGRLTRRFAAGHAELQRSAFISTLDEEEAKGQQQNKTKGSPMEDYYNCNDLNNNDMSMTVSMDIDTSCSDYESYDSQRRKKPRRVTANNN